MKHRVQVGHVQNFPRTRAQIHGVQLGIILRAEYNPRINWPMPELSK